jgi:hypothetical protein
LNGLRSATVAASSLRGAPTWTPVEIRHRNPSLNKAEFPRILPIPTPRQAFRPLHLALSPTFEDLLDFFDANFSPFDPDLTLKSKTRTDRTSESHRTSHHRSRSRFQGSIHNRETTFIQAQRYGFRILAAPRDGRNSPPSIANPSSQLSCRRLSLNQADSAVAVTITVKTFAIPTSHVQVKFRLAGFTNLTFGALKSIQPQSDKRRQPKSLVSPFTSSSAASRNCQEEVHPSPHCTISVITAQSACLEESETCSQ